MSDSFQKNEYVIYGKVGVCRVLDRQQMTFGAVTGEYYVLCPQNDPRSSLYVPCDNQKLMERLRRLMVKEEIDQMLAEITAQENPAWIDEKNERVAGFRAVLAERDCRKLLMSIRCLLMRQQERAAVGRKISTADEAMLQDCTRALEEEFALALEIPRSRVPGYIRDHLLAE